MNRVSAALVCCVVIGAWPVFFGCNGSNSAPEDAEAQDAGPGQDGEVGQDGQVGQDGALDGSVTPNNRPWGAMYAPYAAMTQYEMTGVVTGQMTSAGEIINELQTAQAAGVAVILTVGQVAECNHMQDNVFQYDDAVAHFDGILTADVKAALPAYVNDGTLRGLRLYDEAHDCDCCDTYYTLTNCRNTGQFEERTDISSVPIGADGAPGYADLLHHVQTTQGGLPANLPIGGTSIISYMVQVADRMNELRLRDNLPPLGPKSILGAFGFRGLVPSADFISCVDTNYSTVLPSVYFFLYPSCEDETSNYLFFANYIAFCEWGSVDFINSWSWTSGAAGDFQSRIEDLADGGVTDGVNTITLQDLLNACN